MSDFAIRTKDIVKDYNIYTNGIQKLKGVLFGKHNGVVKNALKGISIEIKKGEKVAILGNIGAGRSTLVRVLSGITYPTSGTVEIDGKVTTIIDLRTGFDVELTGRENIYIKGAIMGISRKEMKKKEQEIIEFAEMEDIIDLPMRSYRAGFAARLGFAIYFAFPPEILLLDDNIVVGDKVFRAKCLDKINEVIDREGATLVVVSNQVPTIKKLCNKIMVIDSGQIHFEGDIDEGVKYFRKHFKKKLKGKDQDAYERDDDDDDDDYDDF